MATLWKRRSHQTLAVQKTGMVYKHAHPEPEVWWDSLLFSAVDPTSLEFPRWGKSGVLCITVPMETMAEVRSGEIKYK